MDFGYFNDFWAAHRHKIRLIIKWNNQQKDVAKHAAGKLAGPLF